MTVGSAARVVGMTGDAVPELLAIRQHQRSGQRSPHKPLLILLALGQLSATGSSEPEWASAAGKLGDLLAEFGPPSGASATQAAAYPFTRLRRHHPVRRPEPVRLLDRHRPDRRLLRRTDPPPPVRAGNRRMNHVLHIAAIVQLRHDTPGREALRCLNAASPTSCIETYSPTRGQATAPPFGFGPLGRCLDWRLSMNGIPCRAVLRGWG